MAINDLWIFLKLKVSYNVMDAYLDDGIMPPSGPGKDGWNFIVDRLRDFSLLGLQNNFKPILVVVPTYDEILDRKKNVAYPTFLVKQSRAMGIVPIALIANFRNSGVDPSKLLIPYDLHFTMECHRIVAESLARVLEPMFFEATSSAK